LIDNSSCVTRAQGSPRTIRSIIFVVFLNYFDMIICLYDKYTRSSVSITYTCMLTLLDIKVANRLATEMWLSGKNVGLGNRRSSVNRATAFVQKNKILLIDHVHILLYQMYNRHRYKLTFPNSFEYHSSLTRLMSHE